MKRIVGHLLWVAAECQAIVTHNARDFGGARPFRVSVVTPAEFLAWIEEDI